MSNLVISVLRLSPELFWDDDPATRHRHETFRRLAADRVEYLEAQVEACSARNSSDTDRIAELEREAALSRDMAANAENLALRVQADYYRAMERVVELEAALRPFAENGMAVSAIAQSNARALLAQEDRSAR